jgi:hypothetical protein
MNNTKEIIYCMNVYDDCLNLKANIKVINESFDNPPIYVASNGINTFDSTPNVKFHYWGSNQGWQLGAVNSTLQSLKLAANDNLDFDNINVIFSHEDVHPSNIEKIDSFLHLLEDYDIIVRSHVGRWSVKDIPYYMLEDFFLRGKLLHRFKEINMVNDLTNNSAEMTFGSIIRNMNLNILEIPFECGSLKEEENELGFIHRS